MTDAHANFAYSTVLTVPSPPTSGTTLVLATGDGAKMPTAPFNGTVWPTAVQPLTSNAEIVRVTAVVGDTLTIARTQESTAARTITVGDQFAAAITVKTLTDIETVVATNTSAISSEVTNRTNADAAVQAFAVQRGNHTGTQSADTLTDGTTNKAFLATERTKLSGIATGATANATDAQLRDRSTHTGTESADVLTDGTTNKAFLATERTKLAGIATAATANSSDATLLNRANHTGTEAAGGDLSGTLPSPTVAKINGVAVTGTPSVGWVPTATSSIAATWQAQAGGSGGLALQAKTSNFTASAGNMYAVDTSGGAVTATLGAASAGTGRLVIKWTAGTTPPVIAVTGSDHINTAGGPTGGSFTLLNQAAQYESDGAALWVVTAEDLALSTLDTRYVTQALVDAKGDLFVGTANDTVARKAVGSDGQVVTADSAQSDGMKWARPTPYPVPSSGDWIVGQFASGATGTTIASQDDMFAMPIWIGATTTFNSIAINVATATASAVMRLGIYNCASATNKPGTLVLDAGTVAAATTGVKQISISQQLTPGLYWLAAVSQVASAKWTGYSAPTPGMALAASSLIMQVPSSNMWHVSGISGGLPSSPTWAASLNSATAGTPVIGLVAA